MKHDHYLHTMTAPAPTPRSRFAELVEAPDDGLGSFGVVPEMGRGHLGFDFDEACPLRPDVKESP